MQRKTSFMAALSAALFLALSVTALLAAPKKDGQGYFSTGYGIRYKKIAFVNVKVYAISHKMKELSAKSARAVIDADTDKKMTLKMLRTVGADKMVDAVRDAFKLNGYTNTGNINRFLSVVSGGDVKEGAYVVISYNSANKTTSIYYNNKSSSVSGIDFMKATWSCWFGKIDQPSLPRGLISQIP